MDTNERSQAEFLKVSRFQSIKTKILIFALLATIVPSLILGWISYLQNSRLLRAKISHELNNATVQTSKELDLWLKERLYDVRVFSSSYVISENLARLMGKRRSTIETLVAHDSIKGYLSSVSEKFGMYEELTLIDLAGQPVVTSSAKSPSLKIPDHWLEQLQLKPSIGIKAQYLPHIGQTSMLIAEEIRTSDGKPLGVLVAKISLDSISSILRQRSVGGIDEVYLVETNGRLLVSSKLKAKALPDATLSFEIPAAMQGDSSEPTDYISHHDKAVVGMAMPITSMGWVMLAEMERDKAYAEISSLRRITIVLVGGLMFCIGLSAYVFGHTVVRPVNRLSKGAAGVASGNLDVDIPVTGFSEVSYLTQVFNHMVANLRQGREEITAANNALLESNKVLHELSITDGLTGLCNRKHIMDLFSREFVRAKRYNQPLAVLMLDVDHFKKINDTYGHQTGDDAVCQLADALRNSVRECDYVGRYGGEEFLIILPNSDIQSGADTAERIRKNVSKLQIAKDNDSIALTVSIGVAGYPDDGQDAKTIIRLADDLLYQAKGSGRNRVMMLGKERGKQAPAPKKEPPSPNLQVIG